MFEMMTGTTPHVRETDDNLPRQELYRRIAEDEVEYPSQFSSSVVDLISRLLCKDP